MMRVSLLLPLALLVVPACRHASFDTQAPTTAVDSVVPPEPAPAPEPEPEPEPAVTAAAANTIVVVMEADDLGGGPDAIIAPPKRPPMPSMLSDIAMAPSH